MSAETYISHYPTGDNLFYSVANLSMVLFPGDFIDGGQIILKCSSRIDRFYEDFTELQIGSRNGDPIPERGKVIYNVKLFLFLNPFSHILLFNNEEQR